MSNIEMLDNEQEKRNFIRNSDTNMFVEAGPGAGKTTFISKRIINQIKKGVSPENFVFLTFTEEAAHELYDKIKKNIKREMMKAEDKEEDILIKALYMLPKMRIMTINKLCYDILDEAGLVDEKAAERYAGMEGMCLDNRELLYKTLELLRTNTDYCNELKKRYTHIYVDEYQDTNELQTAIIWLLASDESGENLRDNSLFVVGDEKQSIYLKEGADVATFKRIKALMSGMANASVITLLDNYRSEATVLQFINNSFSKLFSEYTPMNEDWRVKEENSVYGVKRVVTSCENYSTSVDAIKTSELIAKMMFDESFVIEGKRGEGVRRFCYSDFLVIINNDEIISEYVDAISAKGIPVTVSECSAEEAVKVISLGRVKGLSGNVVILADRSMSRESFFEKKELTLEESEEWIRYEYVAATRARHALVFMPPITKDCKFSEKEFGLENIETIIL